MIKFQNGRYPSKAGGRTVLLKAAAAAYVTQSVPSRYIEVTNVERVPPAWRGLGPSARPPGTGAPPEIPGAALRDHVKMLDMTGYPALRSYRDRRFAVRR